MSSTDSDAITGSVEILSSTEWSCTSRAMSRLSARRLAQTSRLCCSFRKPVMEVTKTRYTAARAEMHMRLSSEKALLWKPVRRDIAGCISCISMGMQESRAMNDR